MDRTGLRVVQGEAGFGVAEAIGPAPDPVAFQEECLRAFEVSQVARGFSQVTVDSATSRLERVLATFGKPACEVPRAARHHPMTAPGRSGQDSRSPACQP